MNPLITVITTSYNSSDTIQASLESVLCQNYPYIQYIVADDCSYDFDAAKINNYLETNNNGNIKEILVIQTKKNEGICKNLNNALNLAKGKYIFNLSADDVFYDINVLTDWVNIFEETKTQVITASRAVYDRELKNLLYTAPSEYEKKMINDCSPQELFEALSGYNIIFGCCTAYTKSIIQEFGGYNEDYPNIEDYPFILKLLRSGIKIHYWDRTVIKYREGGVSSCEHINQEYFKISDKIFENEILPFVSNKRKAKKNYLRWKQDSRFNSDKTILGKKLNKEKSFINKLIYYIILSLKHPIFAIRKIINKFKRYNNGH